MQTSPNNDKEEFGMVKVLTEIKFWLKEVVLPLFGVILAVATKASKS